jgi:hypothetical protein
MQHLIQRLVSGWLANLFPPRRLLKTSLILSSLLLLTALEARADGYTITFVDTGGAPSVSISGTSTAGTIVFDNCASEGCTIVEAPNPSFFLTQPLPQNFYIAAPGPNPIVAAWFQFIVSQGDLVIGFSTSPPIDPLCSEVHCAATIGTGDIIAGQIQWADPVTDTVVFSSGSSGPSPTPEPSSLLLLAAGLFGVTAMKSRKRVAA